MSTTTLVTPGEDADLIAVLRTLERIGVDTEFMRERTYFARLCLVQIATPSTIYLADPLGDGDPSGFWNALMDPMWILHAGRQDIEVIYQATGRMPEALFDTQVAAGLLGYAPQLGYAALVQALFDTVLPKSHTRADWAQRPLPAALLEYAAEDVAYLLDAYDALTERLDRLGRVEWAIEDSQALLDPALYDVQPGDAIQKLKGARKLRGRARRAAAGLAAWRERRALQSDRPRRWILKDSVLLDLAQSNPANQHELAAIDNMPAATIRRSADELLRILGDAAVGDDDEAPPAPPNEAQKAALKRMQKDVADCAETLGIAAEIVAPRRELAAALSGNRDSRVFTGWRRDLIGRRLLDLLN